MLSKLNAKKDQKGFTLIELMIVIAIIGILAAIAIPQFSAYRGRAADAAALADAKNCLTSLHAYMSDYPSLTMADLATANATSGGFVQTSGVTTTVTAGVIASNHSGGTKNYAIALNGEISNTNK